MASINASTSGAGGIITTADATGNLNLQTAGTTAVTIDASQNVGIGTSSPSSYYANKLVVLGTGDTGITVAGDTNATNYLAFADGTSGADRYRGYLAYSHTNNALLFASDATERMRIDSSGNLLVGQSTSVAPAPNNVIGTTIGASGYISMSRNGDLCIELNRTSSDGAVMRFLRQGTQVGSISVTSSATAYNTSSDYRLKENIVPMTGALDTVAALKPVTYKWKVDGSDGQGFIAHELQEVVPDCVSGEKDAIDEEGNPVHQGVDTSFLVATLTAAIQEQQTLITSLTARITALEGA